MNLSKRPLIRRAIAASLIALGAALLALLLPLAPIARNAAQLTDNVFYDAFCRQRKLDDQTNGPVVIVTVDDASLNAINKTYHRGWPWPREFWGYIATYLEQHGAKVVAFDILFEQSSEYQKETGDDDTFASAISALHMPVIFGSRVQPDGAWGPFALSSSSPPLTRPRFGAVNVGDDFVYRAYRPEVAGKPGLAVATVKATGQPFGLATDRPFLLRYYGPHQTPAGQRTFRFVSAANLLAASLPGQTAKAPGISDDLFKDKIVLIGATAVGTYDLKSSPLSREYPGVEVQATAAVNILEGQSVLPVARWIDVISAMLSALVASLGVVFPRRALLKALAPLVCAGAVLGIALLLFTGSTIHWLSPTVPLLAIVLASVGAFSWTYFAEDRQRRFMFKALSKVVSPAIAEQLAREPERLQLGTIRTEITVLFTDLANFTAMSETMDVQKLGDLLNRYLGEMSDQVLLNQGTLDKYIGDAIMCFWNAPLPQAEHAARACRAALAIAQREEEMRDELKAMGANYIFTRIGINTTPAAVGFVGSSHLFNYTALGDGVNLASRLEGANKLYGTRILLSQSTASVVEKEFFLRKVDVLRVKGKQQPMPVYELLGEKLTREKATISGKESLDQRIRHYDHAFAFYQGQQWDQAEQELLEVLRQFADDGAANGLLHRV